jgi:hypothetical protein
MFRTPRKLPQNLENHLLELLSGLAGASWQHYSLTYVYIFLADNNPSGLQREIRYFLF